MTKIRTIQILRGTTSQNNAYTGSAGELTMDTTTNELRLHDGSTVGGHIIGSGGTSSGYHPDLFDWKWADHILDDAQWLMANPFSWQYGSMYQAAYANLSAAIAGKTLQSETVAGITVQFYLADDGHKICPASEESNVLAIYNKTGNAWYYIIDTTNQRFKLPRRHSQQIVRSVKNADGSWYRLYADGWVEQGGRLTTSKDAYFDITLPVAMLNDMYSLLYAYDTVGLQISTSGGELTGQRLSTTQIRINQGKDYGNAGVNWQVSGQSAIDMSSFQNGEKYLYFYVGAFTQTAIENTAGLNAELFNGKADLNLSNIASNIDYVVESQEPIAGNNYTWYRKYKSGWVEQGGRSGGRDVTITMPVEMSDNHYVVLTDIVGRVGYNALNWEISSITTTGFRCFYDGDSSDPTEFSWQVSGIAAN